MAAEPGWYQDPAGGGGERYWDGGAWTQQVRGAGAPPPASEPRSGGFGTNAIIQLVGAAVVAIGAILPWIDSFGFSENSYYADLPWFLTGTADESSGFVGHGFFFMSAALAAATIAFGRYGTRTIQAILDGGIIALVVVDYLSFADAFGQFEEVSMSDVVGIGLYVTALGGAIIVAGSLIPESSLAGGATAQAPPPQGVQAQRPPQSAPPQVPPSDNQWWN